MCSLRRMLGTGGNIWSTRSVMFGYDVWYPASSSSSILTSPFESIVKMRELGMLTLR